MKYQRDRKVKRNAREISLVSGTIAGLCVLGGAVKAINDWPEKQIQYERNSFVTTIENPAYGLEKRISFIEGTIGLGIGLIIVGGGKVIGELYKDFAEGFFSQINYA